jgi:hypothetical protein
MATNYCCWIRDPGCGTRKNSILVSKHLFDADPAFHYNADPHPDPVRHQSTVMWICDHRSKDPLNTLTILSSRPQLWASTALQGYQFWPSTSSEICFSCGSGSSFLLQCGSGSTSLQETISLTNSNQFSGFLNISNWCGSESVDPENLNYGSGSRRQIITYPAWSGSWLDILVANENSLC